ncbi:MAG: signal peptide peptidase SppA [Patescibacteria group bacterium]
MHRTFVREVALIVTKTMAVVVTMVALIFAAVTLFDGSLGISDGTCNVAVLPIEGEIWPFYSYAHLPTIVTPDMVEEFMTSAEDDTAIEAVLIEVNSPGGFPAASERMADRIRSSELPTVGMIGDIGASGGYMVAAATDYLIASPFSIVGSIGVNASYVENSEQNEEDGLTYVQLIAGKYKDAGDPNKPLTEEERALVQRDLDEVHQGFIEMIAEYRSLSVEDVTTLADGSTVTGSRAKEVKLVDAVGARSEAKRALASILGKSESDIVFCEYTIPILPI